jgi:hypothetical protein
MDKIIIQISAGRGPVECCRVVAKVQELMVKQARKEDLKIDVLENKKADLKGTLLSATLLAEGKHLAPFIKEWQGSVQWIHKALIEKCINGRIGLWASLYLTCRSYCNGKIQMCTLKHAGLPAREGKT